MDFITGLPKVFGKDCIFVVVYRLTKFSHLFFVTTTLTTAQVARLFFKEFFKLHGLPKSIVSDRDNIFFSAFWQDLFKRVGTNLTPRTRYHPQIDRQTKRVNQWLEGYLRNYVSGQQKAWIKWLHLGEFCYNTTFHMSIGMSPFKALYGYDAYTFIDHIFGDIRAPKDKDWIEESQEILKFLRGNLQVAQNQQKHYEDQHIIERQLQENDLVYLRFHAYKQTTIKGKGSKNIKPRLYGP